MTAPWRLVILVPFAISFLLLAASQFMFLRGSVHADLGYGQIGSEFTLANYLRVLQDPFYLQVLNITVLASALAAGIAIAAGFPIAYVIARMRSRWGMILLATVVLSSFITIVIKIFGLIIIFQADGPLNRLLLSLGIVEEPVTIIGNFVGVVIGLTYFSFGLAVLLIYGIVQTIPRSLEEAAQIHGCNRLDVFRRILLPLSLPGLTVGFLTIFNMSMGAFTSAALLGGGRVLTLPVLIQRTILLEVKYGMGATLAAVLLISVILINLLSVIAVRRFRAARMLVT